MIVICRPTPTRPVRGLGCRTALRFRGRRAGAVGVLAALAVIGGATSAAAHVHVFPDSTTAGQDAQLTFRVPDESPGAGTVRLIVTLPQGRPFTDVVTKPVPGWRATVTDATLPKPVDVGGATITKAPRTLTWVAQPGTQIAPGQYQEFAFATDALPAAGEVALPVAQVYSDGTVVRWDEPSLPGKAEPEHPAPTFTITAATGIGAGVTSVVSTLGLGAGSTRATATDGTARFLGVAGLLVSVFAAGLALAGRRPKRDPG
jgi:periplasmic copper chaperone A